jgi:hypothetical protein
MRIRRISDKKKETNEENEMKKRNLNKMAVSRENEAQRKRRKRRGLGKTRN